MLSESLTCSKLSIFIIFFLDGIYVSSQLHSHHEQVVLYEDELADSGVSLLTVKVVITNLVSSVDRGSIFVMQIIMIAND